MRAPNAAMGLVSGKSAPVSTATPAQAGLRHLAAGLNRTCRPVGRRGLSPQPSAAMAQPRLPGKPDLHHARRGLAASAAVVSAGPGASLPLGQEQATGSDRAMTDRLEWRSAAQEPAWEG